MKPKILPKDFYQDEDVVKLSKELLGKFIVTKINNQLTSGMIVETEAYRGVEDKASHAYQNRRTQRTKTMFLEGGIAYVYLCYGIHHLFNVVTAAKNNPHAILVRAIEPIDGIPTMLRRRNMSTLSPQLTSGPGKLTQALGITTKLDGYSLREAPLWIEDRGIIVIHSQIIASPRVGINYAQEHRELPWRFRLKNSRWTSK